MKVVIERTGVSRDEKRGMNEKISGAEEKKDVFCEGAKMD